MLVFAFAILLFLAVGVVFIVRRQEMAEGPRCSPAPPPRPAARMECWSRGVME